MSDMLQNFSDQYATALQRYLAHREEGALEQAYALGRKALAEKIGLVELATVHQKALADSLNLSSKPAKRDSLIKAGDEFFRECVGPFEMTLRGFQESMAKLKQMNEILEKKVTERTESMRRTAESLRALFQASPLAVIELDPKGHVLMWNPAAERLFGWKQEEVLGLANPIIPADEQEKARFLLVRALQGESYAMLETIRQKKDGSTIPVSFSLGPLYDSEGKTLGAVVVIADITERKRMEDEIRRSRDELEMRVQERTADLARTNQELQEEMVRREIAEHQMRQAQKMEAIGILTGGIAHDFNNILQTIGINADLALFDLPGGSSVWNNVDLIRQSALRGKDLVSRMLLFSRKSEKKQEILNLIPLIKETFKLLRSSIPTTIQMNLHLETESDAVYADLSQIQQVIMNLCTNAVYAMQGKTGAIDLCLRATTFGPNDLPEADMHPGDYLILSVEDSGCGMDEEVKKRIFEPFFTTKPAGEGTGLGLSVVYGIVKSHKGSVTVYSEPGKGTIFKVCLPKASAGVSSKVETLGPIPRGKERILFVDDEKIIVESVRNMLQHLGYQVTALMDSREALKLFSADPFRFDLVITDQTMPFMMGETLGQEMMRIRPDIPVILCTGYADLISSEKATAVGFRDFIMKPFTVREGAELVRRVLDQKEPGDK